MSGRSRSWVRRLLVLTALVLIAGPATLVYATELLPPPVVQTLNEVTQTDPQTALLFTGAAVGVLGLLSLWVWQAESRSEQLADRDTEEPDREAAIAREYLTKTFERRRTGTYVSAVRDDGSLSKALRGVLIEVYTHKRGTCEAAEQYIENGDWTADRYAAAFVTTSDTIDYPLYFRLFAWLYPGEAYEYRAKRALREVETVCEMELSGYEAPDRSTGWRGRLHSVYKHRGDAQPAHADRSDSRSIGSNGGDD